MGSLSRVTDFDSGLGPMLRVLPLGLQVRRVFWHLPVHGVTISRFLKLQQLVFIDSSPAEVGSRTWR